MKKILISIKPKYVAEILNYRKTLEIRKSFPKCELPCEVYIYCTKGSPYLYDIFNHRYSLNKIKVPDYLNGKVIAKFTLNKVHEINKDLVGDEEYEGYKERCYESREIKEDELLKLSCLDYLDLRFYLDPHDYPKRGKVGYAWHIDNLVIFDKPKELKEFKHPIHCCPLRCDNNFVPSFCKDHCKHNKDPERLDVWCDRVDKWCEPLTKAPQSWCYCEVEE